MKTSDGTMVAMISPGTGEATQLPADRMIRPRAPYSSPAACSGVVTSMMISSATLSPVKFPGPVMPEACGNATAEMPM